VLLCCSGIVRIGNEDLLPLLLGDCQDSVIIGGFDFDTFRKRLLLVVVARDSADREPPEVRVVFSGIQGSRDSPKHLLPQSLEVCFHLMQVFFFNINLILYNI